MTMLPFTEYKNKNSDGSCKCQSLEVEDIVGKDGVGRTFKFLVFELIQRDTRDGEFESFEFRAKDLDNTDGELISIIVTNFAGVYQVTNMISEGTLLREKGIPEILIAYSCDYLKADIESSSNIKLEMRYFGERRYPDGEKVWKRLKKMEDVEVSYDETSDRFKLHYS